MRNRTRFLTLWTLFALAPLLSQWPTEVDSSIFVDFGLSPYLAIDPEEESVIVVYRFITEIYAKKFDRYGFAMWDGNRVTIMDTLNGDIHRKLRVISDRSGGVVACWEDHRHSTENNEIYIQRVSSAGITLYGTNGKRISGPASEGLREGLRSLGDLKADNNGGFVVGYFGDTTAYAGAVKRYDFTGQLTWEQYFPEGYNLDINATDHDGNIFVSYGGAFDQPNRRMKLDLSGNLLWPDTLSGQIPDVRSLQGGGSYSDQSGGVIGAKWESSGHTRINRADSYGHFVFEDTGILIEGSSSAYHETDSAGGIYSNWSSFDGAFTNHLQRVGVNGQIAWPLEGVVVCSGAECYGVRGIASNNRGGVLVMWPEGVGTPTTTFYVQDFDSSGGFIWDSTGVELYRTNKDPNFISPERFVYSDLRGGAVVVWIEQSPAFEIMIKQISKNGFLGEVTTSISDREPTLSKSFQLYQNYPNPFNSSTNIKFKLPKPTQLELSIYDISGRKARVLVSGSVPAGEHTVNWDGTDNEGRRLASGVYLVRLLSHHFSTTRKMLLIS